jgi:hypothetical protein
MYSQYEGLVEQAQQGVTERRRLSWLTTSALVYEPKCGERLWGCRFSAKEYSFAHGDQINSGDLTPYGI